MRLRSRIVMAVVWAVLVGAPISSSALGSGPSIIRGLPPLELGMPLEQFLNAVPAEEIGADGDTRVFSVTGRRANVTGFLCTFTKGRLSRIEVSHSVDYSAKISWKDFVAGTQLEYGTGFRLRTQSGDIEMWDDGWTTLILERRWVTRRDRSYVITFLDDAIAIERHEQCAPRKFTV